MAKSAGKLQKFPVYGHVTVETRSRQTATTATKSLILNVFL
jgi:hypothetical protein